MGKQISLTVTSSGSVFSINTDNIIEIVDNGAGTDVTYVKTIGQGAGSAKIAVDESVASIVTASDSNIHAFYTTRTPEVVNAWVTYDNAVGDFTVGEQVVINGVTRAIVQEDTGTVLKITGISNGLIANNDTIVGVTSGATGLVNGTIIPATDNVAIADRYTYSNGVDTRYLNVDKIRSATPYNIGNLNVISYDYQGASYDQISALTTISDIESWVNASTSDVELASTQTFTGINSFSNAAGIKTDVVAEYTAAAGVTVDGVLLKDGLLVRKTTTVTTTGVTQTLNCGANDVIFFTTTTATDLAKLSNSAISAGHQISLVYAAEGAGADELVLSKLNAGDGIGFTTITFSAIGDTASLCWSGTAWFVVGVNGAVVA